MSEQRSTPTISIISPKTGEPLCPEWAKRAAMPDAEFWDYVFNRDEDARLEQLIGWEPWEPEWDDTTDAAVLIGTANPCPVCGCLTTCGYDTEGRPFIHTTGA